MEEHLVILMDENKEHMLNVWFWGFSIEKVQAFIKEHYADNPRNWRWVQFKIVS